MDRNREQFKYVVQCRVALRKESVDRNINHSLNLPSKPVALRKESVDRNINIESLGSKENASLSARRAWIEMRKVLKKETGPIVALRKESVDRNILVMGRSLAQLKVALRKESVDRNTQRRDFKRLGLSVALRKESVDRNILVMGRSLAQLKSLSARRAWIEIQT